MKKSRLRWVLTGVATQFFLAYSSASFAEKVVVIPLGMSQKAAVTTCTAADEVKSYDQCWKTFNLGATQVATASNDTAAYGDLYQWGRLADGHQKRGVSMLDPAIFTPTPSSTDVPGHNKFIINNTDWRTPQNDFLWQGLGGINNPCPQGFRLPTYQEFTDLLANESITNAGSAYSSSLKFVVAGFRLQSNSTIINAGSYGYYWSSTVSDTSSYGLLFHSNYANLYSYYRADGLSVRCLKD